MSFAILGGISAAIAEGATAALVGTGLGTAAGATAVGTGGVGLMSAGTTAALASGLGAAGTGALVGSGLGAAGSALTGGDPGKGAMMGALGGAATGGIGSALGAGTGAATGSTGTAVLDPMFGVAPTAASEGLGSTLGGVGTEVAKAAVPTAVQGIGGMMGSGYSGPSATNTALKTQQEAKKAKELGGQVWGLAVGGSVDLHDGDFILPADIVSAMGNGSTKAGAQFLDEFFGVS